MKNLVILSIIITGVMFTSCTKAIRTESITDTGAKVSAMDKTESGKKPGNEIKEPVIKDTSGNTGVYTITMSGYKGELTVESRDGKFEGTIKFYNWGNGVPHPLTDLRITDNKIYFKRVIRTRDDLIKYGGTAFFEQDFYGIFSEDKKKIKGYYRYAGTQDGWEAVKAQ